MMLRVNGQYLDFNGDIEIEKKIKLFDDIETTDGDVSFAFELQLTSNNIDILNKPFPDSSSKTVYTIQDTEVLNDEGMLINRGYIRIERVTGRIASCSFWGGNNNWFSALVGNMTDLNLTMFDEDLDETNIALSWNRSSGIVYPLIDTGALVTRGYINTITEDFLGCFYAHTLIKEVFQQSGLKVQGELIDDPFYKKLIIVANGRSQDAVTARSSYIGKTVPQTTIGDDNFFLLTFDDETITPHFDGSQDNFDIVNSRYTADIKMTVDIEINIVTTIDGSTSGAVIIYLNGSYVLPGVFLDVYGGDFGQTFTFYTTLNLEAGDYIEVFTGETVGNTFDITGGYLKVTPTFLYKTFGRSSVPLWTKQDFVSNVFALFNTVISYDSFTKTVTINLFDKIKHKEPIDISEFIQVESTDYSEFISNYGKHCNFRYNEGNDPDVEEYNISEFVKYGDGVIEVDNDFLENNADVIESDFSSPISYVNNVFNSSLERINFVELEEFDEVEITSVTDSGGVPRFQITDADDYFTEGKLVRIETDEINYNGDFVITSVTSSYITVRGLNFGGDAVGLAIVIEHQLTTDDNVYIMAFSGQQDTNDLFGFNSIFLNDVAKTNFAIAYFNLLITGNVVDSLFKQGLSFGSINNPLSFQRNLLQTYWTQFDRSVNDPVKEIGVCHLPWKVYNEIDFLRPITIKTLETSNLYYANLISGYKNSYTPCTIELIKLP